MPENDFDNFSDTKLEYMLQQGYNLEMRNRILAELEKRNKKKDDQAKSQFATSICWNKTAAFAAIIGVALMIVQIIISIFQYNSSQKNDLNQIQSIKQISNGPPKVR